MTLKQTLSQYWEKIQVTLFPRLEEDLPPLTQNQQNRLTHVICEARGRIEDRSLELEFSHVCSGHNSLKKILPFELIIADKKTNSEGLQFADLAARPVGLSVVRPSQFNRAFQILEKKFYKNREGWQQLTKI